MNWVLKNLGARDYLIGILAVALIGIVQKWHDDHVELAKAQLVYLHPQIVYKDRVVTKTGPVRIKTVIVHEPSGAEKTEIDEDIGETTEESVASSTTAPVPLSVALKEPRTDRYLVSVGMNRLTADFDGKAVFVGYGWKNRLDVQVGAVKHDGTSPWVLATLRF